MKYYANYKSLEYQIKMLHRYILENGDENNGTWTYCELVATCHSGEGKIHYEVASPEHRWEVSVDFMKDFFDEEHSVITMKGISIYGFRKVLAGVVEDEIDMEVSQ